MKKRSHMKPFDSIKMRHCRQCLSVWLLTQVLVILTFHPGQGISSLFLSFRDEKSFLAPNRQREPAFQFLVLL